ncbi:MAG: S1C family serine protease, partial [Acidimicrobiales bacterium]
TSTAELAATLAPSLARVQVGHDDQWTSGTGVWLDEQGALLVATPLLGGDPSDAITVARDGEAPAPATVVGSDPATGVSVVRVADPSGTPLDVRTAAPDVGTTVAVIAAGRPSSGATASRTVTAAIGTVGDRATVPPLVLHDALLLDRAVPDDAVGAVVVDGHGHVVGVVVAAADADGLAVVAPADTAMAAARDLRGDGAVRRAWLGVRAVDLSPAQARLLDVAGGARLTQVTPGSPAATAGLRPDDVITEVDGHATLDASALVTALRRWQPGERVEVTWRRGTESLTATCTLGG